MSKFKVGDKVRLVEDVDGDFDSYGLKIGRTGVVHEVDLDEPFGHDVCVDLGDIELLFRDFELEAVTDGR